MSGRIKLDAEAWSYRGKWAFRISGPDWVIKEIIGEQREDHETRFFSAGWGGCIDPGSIHSITFEKGKLLPATEMESRLAADLKDEQKKNEKLVKEHDELLRTLRRLGGDEDA